MDVRELEFENESFDVVIDKGLLDSILVKKLIKSGNYSILNSEKMLNEIYRVLRQKGIYICISYGTPKIRGDIF